MSQAIRRDKERSLNLLIGIHTFSLGCGSALSHITTSDILELDLAFVVIEYIML
jgi:cyanate permease